MIVGLVVVFGAVVGLACYYIEGSGYGLGWDISLGVAGSILASCLMTVLYLLGYFAKADTIGLNWYSLAVGSVGACASVYVGLLFKKISVTLKLEKIILPAKIRAA